MKQYWNKLSPKQKLITKLTVAALVGGTVVGGVCYTAGQVNVAEFLEEPTEAASIALEAKLIEFNPGYYVDVATGYIAEHPEEMQAYTENLATFVYAVNEADLLTEDGQIYMFAANANEIPVEVGVKVCNENILPRTENSLELEYVLTGVKQLDVDDYGTILLEMGAQVKGTLTEDIKDLFNWGDNGN